MRFLLYYHFLALTIAQVFCECGKTVVRVNSLADPGFPTDNEHGNFPWHVGIYSINWTSAELDHICGGSLIASDLVISAAHCFYKEDERRVDDAFNYAVAAGKVQRSYHELEDVEQKSQVKTIHVPDAYVGLRGNITGDIAVLRLHRSFAITEFVSPVCIDRARMYNRAQLRNGEYGKVMGWGSTGEGDLSGSLQKITLPYVDHDHCLAGAPEDLKSLVTSDKICAGSTNGSSVYRGEAGGGYCFQSAGRWYLRGVASVDAFLDNSTSNDNYNTAFTNVEHYLEWIGEFLDDAGERDPTMDFVIPESCSLPEQPEGGRFEQHLFGKSPVHSAGSEVPINSVLIYRCTEGYIVWGNDFSVCTDKGWTPFPTCVKCGIAESMETPLIVNGSRVMHGSFPWHVAIYIKASNMINTAGTLIKPDLVVSEAYWFYDDARKLPYDVDWFFVTAGKYYPSYYKTEPYAQTSYVKEIHIHSNYSDDRDYYANDIALLRLKTPFAMSKLVRPVCLDRRSGIAAQFPEFVKIPMWGSFRPAFSPDHDYLEAQGRLAERDSCSIMLAENLPLFSTSGTSCFQLTANVSLESFDLLYKGGIYAEKNNKWYLVGFALDRSNSHHNFLLSTNLDIISSWILQVERD